ncbi:MAG: glycosyltransferase family 1 protein [candidate division WOR-3 bacterium]
MHVVVDGSFCTGAPSGIERYVTQVVVRLARRAEVTVLSPAPRVFDGLVQNVIPIPSWTGGHRSRVLWQLSLMHRYCSRRHDILFCPVPVAPPLSPVPVVSVVHDLTPLILHRWHGTQQKSLFWLSLQSLRRASAVLADSENTRRDFLNLRLVAPNRVRVAPLGSAVKPNVHLDDLAASLRPFVLYVGCLYPHKNLLRLMSAYKQVCLNSSVRLVIAGTDIPVWVSRTRNAIARENLEGRVVMLGEVSDAELAGLYRQCEAFVFPSLYEGFGLPVLEAMSNGAPVVCSNASSLPEVAGDSAVYFDPRDANDIARALMFVLANPAEAGRMRESGHARSLAFSWDRTAEIVFLTLEQVLAGRHHSPIRSLASITS